ncbi:MAG: hypothetical protein J6Z14_09945 [Prevotella sp.]|nr:hypothetical protein [Prevotella sp.]
MKSIKFIYAAFTILMTSALFVSCDEEEEVALSLSGTWQTTDQLFTRTFNGQTLRTTKTVFYFIQERENATVGDGYAVEYYDNTKLPMSYHHTQWQTWTRQNGDVGIQVHYQETHDKFSTISYHIDGSNFNGKCNLNDGPDQDFKFTKSTQPDLSSVQFWGYNELMPTWHQTSFEGKIYIEREYQGKKYYPKNVVITFDVDPAYNTGMTVENRAFIKEEYDDAPWGTYLADTIRFWDKWNSGSYLYIYLNDGYDPYHHDYELQDITCTESELKGHMFVRTNVFEDFTLKRINTPDWSAIKEWGFRKWLPQTQE